MGATIVAVDDESNSDVRFNASSPPSCRTNSILAQCTENRMQAKQQPDGDQPIVNIVGKKIALGPLRRDLIPTYQVG